MLAETDYCGLVSGAKHDKSALFDISYGQLEGAPLIQACPVSLVCRVVKEFCIQHRQIFVAEVVETFVDEQFLTWDGDSPRVDELTRLDPILYALDNRYYRIGPPIGVGYQEGRQLL
jgi:flavin reductase (DIM6/NTAB) family NADH-FMN oxidoreductase RutF